MQLSKSQLTTLLQNVHMKRHPNIDVFNRSIKIYNDALCESNFKETIQFVIPALKNNDENQKHKRKWNIIWFNTL